MTAPLGTVVFVFDTLELGGAERQGLLLARYLAQRGVNAQIWGLTGGPGRAARLCDEYGLPWRAVRLAWRAGLARVPFNAAEIVRFGAALRAARPAALLPYTFFSNVLTSLVWRATGARTCIWNQRDAGFYLDSWGWAPWREPALRLAPRFVANSHHGAAALRAAGVRHVDVVHNGVELAPPLASRAAWRARLELDEARPVAAMLSTIKGNKDHATLLRAWQRVRERCDAVLLLAGRIEDPSDASCKLAIELGLGDSVRFLGPVDDVSGLLGAIDVCVHSARSEGLPNAVLEAMAAGRPVVGTDVPGLREAVGSAGTRYLAPSGDAGALAERIVEVLCDSELRCRLGAEAATRARAEFGPSAMCETMLGYLVQA